MRKRIVLMSALVLGAAACLPEGMDLTGPTNPYNLELRANPTSISLEEGGSTTFAVGDTTGAVSVYVFDVGSGMIVGNAFPSVSVADPTVADFDEDGNLVGLKAGTTTLTATFEDVNRGQTLSLDVPITVTAAP